MKKIFGLIAACCYLFVVAAQPKKPVNIEITFDKTSWTPGYKQDTILLALKYKDILIRSGQLIQKKHYNVTDKVWTLKLDSALKPGIYGLILKRGNTELGEFVVANNAKTEYEMFVKAGIIGINNDEEQDVFNDYKVFNMRKAALRQALKDKWNAKQISADTLKKINEEIRINTDLYRISVKKNHPKSYVSQILLSAFPDYEVPMEIQKKGELAILQYKKLHYWDYFDPTDNRFIYGGKLETMLHEYFDRYFEPQKDSIWVGVEQLLDSLAKTASEEVFAESIQVLTQKYSNNKLMCGDKLLVNLMEKYVCTPANPAKLKESVKTQLCNDLPNRKKVCCGNPMPMLEYYDFHGGKHNLFDNSGSFTVLCLYKFQNPGDSLLFNGLANTANNWSLKGVETVVLLDTFGSKFNAKLPKLLHQTIDESIFFTLSQKGQYEAYLKELYVNYQPAIFLLDKNMHIVLKQIGFAQINEYLSNQFYD